MKVDVVLAHLAAILVIVVGSQDGVVEKPNTLYLLSLLSYPDTDPSLVPSRTDGRTIIAGAQLAVSEINNRTDVLANYNLELIPADDGCNFSWKAVISLIDNLYYSGGKQIVGIIGPACSDATKAVAPLTGQPDIALINVHLGSAPELGNRYLYPYSFGINPSTFNQIDSMIALFSNNNWTRAAVLYSPDMLVNYNSFLLFKEKLNGKVNLSFVSPATPDYLPLEALRSTYVRVIVSFLSAETLQLALCLAFHMGMTYPRYQWLLLTPNQTDSADFVYGNSVYSCNDEEIGLALNQSLAFYTSVYIQYTSITYTDLNSDYVQGTVCSWATDCIALFDAVWALAMAFNNSIGPLWERGLSLSNYTYGKEQYTQIIQQQMYKLDFSGVAGNTIQFNPLEGYISSESVLTQMYTVLSPYYIVATYSTLGGLQIDPTTAVFVSTSFEEEHVLVSLPLVVTVIVVDAVAALLVLGIHVVNTVYKNHKAIKASSSRLNHFAYIGCYIILLATLLYTIKETFPISIDTKTVLCNAFPWTLSIGLTLVFGTVTVKTWRLHFIFKSSSKLRKSYNVMMSDGVLAVLILIMVVPVVGICTAWSIHDPYIRNTIQTLLPSGDTLVVSTEEFCYCHYQVQWISSIIAIETIFIIILILLAFSTRSKKKKEFQTQSILVLAYLLTLYTVVVGVIYLITVIVGAGINTSYGILSSMLTVAVYLCAVLLFLPPIMPVIYDIRHPRRRRTESGLTVCSNVSSVSVGSVRRLS